MFHKTRAIARQYGAKVVAGTVGALAFASAHAAGTGIDSLFDEVDLSGIAAKITALAVIIVGIALVMKGPAIVKRIIAKI
ncbi:hypothetical protein V8Z74_17105 [Comamonas sp. w2-DMI]|uniref:hypothetical protein n=1 Tax=Comamonas sp. w2-DMI TaxID=3126391 RepID=UPI0032E39FA8